jgi:tetratricopeptide (TPR) repeat protein
LTIGELLEFAQDQYFAQSAGHHIKNEANGLGFCFSLGEAHTSLAFALDLYGWDWETAEAEYKLAIKLNPGYATAHLWYAWHLILMGRNSEGLFELRKAESLDPLSLIISADMADALCIAHLID